MPEDAVYVGRGTRWGNPYRVGYTQVRMPALDGSEWELEGRGGKTSGQRHPFHHPGGTFEKPIISLHQVEDATAEQCVELYRRLLASRTAMRLNARALAGTDLACWCPLDQPCHADVLIALANPPGERQGP